MKTKHPTITTRPALPTDAIDIARIWNGYIRDSLVTFNSIEKTIQEVQDLIANQPFFVAEIPQNIIGFATYGAFRNGIGYTHSKEHTVMIAPDNTGDGAGRALMSAIMDEARSNGTHSLFAGITGSNQPAIDFHRTLGFIHRAHIPEAGYSPNGTIWFYCNIFSQTIAHRNPTAIANNSPLKRTKTLDPPGIYFGQYRDLFIELAPMITYSHI